MYDAIKLYLDLEKVYATQNAEKIRKLQLAESLA